MRTENTGVIGLSVLCMILIMVIIGLTLNRATLADSNDRLTAQISNLTTTHQAYIQMCNETLQFVAKDVQRLHDGWQACLDMDKENLVNWQASIDTSLEWEKKYNDCYQARIT